MPLIVCTHAIPPIWHTHQGKYKKQVQLELNMYFENLMHMTTNTCPEISADTMQQCVAGLVTPKTTMHILSDDLDRGAILVHLDATKARVHFNNMSPLSAWTPSWKTNIGIISPPSTITSMSKSWSHHNVPSVSDVLHGFLKPFCLTWVHVHCNVISCQVEVQVSIVGCRSHRVYKES